MAEKPNKKANSQSSQLDEEDFNTETRRRIKFTVNANGINDHVTMFSLHLPLAIFSFLVKLSSFPIASKARIVLHYYQLCTIFFKKT